MTTKYEKMMENNGNDFNQQQQSESEKQVEKENMKNILLSIEKEKQNEYEFQLLGICWNCINNHYGMCILPHSSEVIVRNFEGKVRETCFSYGEAS